MARASDPPRHLPNRGRTALPPDPDRAGSAEVRMVGDVSPANRSRESLGFSIASAYTPCRPIRTHPLEVRASRSRESW
jgi:hypothetical protein